MRLSRPRVLGSASISSVEGTTAPRMGDILAQPITGFLLRNGPHNVLVSPASPAKGLLRPDSGPFQHLSRYVIVGHCSLIYVQTLMD